MVDLLQLLEGTAYIGFIAGAIFAMVEVRSIKKNRETEFLMSMNEHWSSQEFQETLVRIRDMPYTEDPKEIEDRCERTSLYSYVEYLDGIAMLAENKSLKLGFVLGLAEWFGFWEKLEPWILYERAKGRGIFAGGFEWLVAEDQKWFLRNMSKEELAS